MSDLRKPEPGEAIESHAAPEAAPGLPDAADPREVGPPPHAPAWAQFAAGAEADVWETLVRWRAAGRRLALLSVIETRGFTPRKSGARMLLAEDGETFGSIGGGAIELAALEAARTLLGGDSGAPGVSRTLRWHLTQELGMCCGGEMRVHLEVVEADPVLVVFGAGYIGRALASIALGCGFRVTVVDERPEWAEAGFAPRVRVVCRDPEAFARAEPPGPGDYAVIVTHDHALDQRLVEVLLRRPPRFLGMVGSLPKQRKFALRLRARGFPDEAIARLRSPLGVAIGAATPEEIAVSVMAELIAARRGIEIESPSVPLGRHGVPAPRAGVAAAVPDHPEVQTT